MNLKEQATKFLIATNPAVWLTYDEYARELINDGVKPITPGQWDMLLSVARGRKMQDTLVVSQITTNMRTAASDKANTGA